jgi:enterochelin esterase-like enzyme
MKKLAFFPAVFYTAICLSQPPRGPLIESPVISADHSVTFRYRDPNVDSPDADAINKRLKLFTISVGTDDFLYESVKQNIALFQEKKINLDQQIVSGGHTWMNCKLYLATTLQKIFKD